jgi:hypothetical protein
MFIIMSVAHNFSVNLQHFSPPGTVIVLYSVCPFFVYCQLAVSNQLDMKLVQFAQRRHYVTACP